MLEFQHCAISDNLTAEGADNVTYTIVDGKRPELHIEQYDAAGSNPKGGIIASDLCQAMAFANSYEDNEACTKLISELPD